MLETKVCVVGAFATGKTSLVAQLLEGTYVQRYQTTIGVRIERKQIETAHMQMDMVLWDMHSEDQFQQVQMSYLRAASAYVLVVDGTRRSSLTTALDLQKRVTQRIGNVPCVMVINKCDLQTDWEITEDDIALLKAQNYDLIRTSTKTGVGIDQCLSKLLEKLSTASQELV
jgi:small GTP-binding protein